MSDKNTLGKFEYLIYNCMFLVCFFLLYQIIFFRGLPETTITLSKWILGTFSFVAIMVGYGLTARKRRNFVSVTVNALFPFAVYWVVTYHRNYRVLTATVVAVALLLSLVYLLITVSTYIWLGIKSSHKKSVAKAVWFSLLNARTVAVLCLSLVFVTAIPELFGLPLVQSSTKATVGNSCTRNFTIESEIETLLVFSDGTWEQLSNSDKLTVLQTVANIEAAHLGIPHELNVGVDALPNCVKASYNDSLRSILIDIDSLENDDAYNVLDTVVHEARHAYQYRLVSLYQAAAEEYKKLFTFQEVQKYEAEFANYIHGTSEGTFDDYYNQSCEQDARAYAADRSHQVYRSYIEEYMENTRTQ